MCIKIRICLKYGFHSSGANKGYIPKTMRIPTGITLYGSVAKLEKI